MEFQAAVSRIKFSLLCCYSQREVTRGLGKDPGTHSDHRFRNSLATDVRDRHSYRIQIFDK